MEHGAFDMPVASDTRTKTRANEYISYSLQFSWRRGNPLAIPPLLQVKNHTGGDIIML
jgi:hypothetical protein